MKQYESLTLDDIAGFRRAYEEIWNDEDWSDEAYVVFLDSKDINKSVDIWTADIYVMIERNEHGFLDLLIAKPDWESLLAIDTTNLGFANFEQAYRAAYRWAKHNVEGEDPNQQQLF